MLDQIQVNLPLIDSEFAELFLSYLSPVGSEKNKSISFTQSNNNYFPHMSLAFKEEAEPHVCFKHDEDHDVSIANTTGKKKESPHKYTD